MENDIAIEDSLTDQIDKLKDENEALKEELIKLMNDGTRLICTFMGKDIDYWLNLENKMNEENKCCENCGWWKSALFNAHICTMVNDGNCNAKAWLWIERTQNTKTEQISMECGIETDPDFSCNEWKSRDA